jgi:hypothetical protein
MRARRGPKGREEWDEQGRFIGADSRNGKVKLSDLAIGDLVIGDLVIGDLVIGDLVIGDLVIGDLVI